MKLPKTCDCPIVTQPSYDNIQTGSEKHKHFICLHFITKELFYHAFKEGEIH